MLCKIAELYVEIPEAGGLPPRCQAYLSDVIAKADITIYPALYRSDRYPLHTSHDLVSYMESAYQFYVRLLEFDGFYIHASAVEFEGRAYLFSAPSGTGKSTHTSIWQSIFFNAKVFNDDKPALRFMNGSWYAYGTPWCGKDGINQNLKVSLTGICFLKRGKQNRMRRISASEAALNILSQTIRKDLPVDLLDMLLGHIDKLVREIPIYELECQPNEDAARLSYETMRRGAEEMGL